MSKAVHKAPGGLALVAGIKWSVLNGNKEKSSEIRSVANLVGAKHYVINESDDIKYIGLATPDILEQKPSRKSASFALACLTALALKNPDELNAIFVLGVDNDPEKRVLCVIRNGQISVDTIDQRSNVLARAEQSYQEFGCLCSTYFENDEAAFTAESISWDELISVAQANKHICLKRVPSSPLLPIAIGAILALAASAIAYNQMILAPKKQADRLKRMASNDRTGPYLQALAKAAQEAGFSKNFILDQLNQYKSYPYLVNGWSLASIHCDRTRCTESWSRVGGNLKDLIENRQGRQYQADLSKNTDSATFVFDHTPEFEKLNVDLVPRGQESLHKEIRPVIHKLDAAGVSLSIVQKNQGWPLSNVSGIKPEAIIRAHATTLTADFPLMPQALDLIPDIVRFDSFSINTSSPKKFTVTLKGLSYVR